MSVTGSAAYLAQGLAGLQGMIWLVKHVTKIAFSAYPATLASALLEHGESGLGDLCQVKQGHRATEKPMFHKLVTRVIPGSQVPSTIDQARVASPAPQSQNSNLYKPYTGWPMTPFPTMRNALFSLAAQTMPKPKSVSLG